VRITLWMVVLGLSRQCQKNFLCGAPFWLAPGEAGFYIGVVLHRSKETRRG